jgi:hypothetical protein
MEPDCTEVAVRHGFRSGGWATAVSARPLSGTKDRRTNQCSALHKQTTPFDFQDRLRAVFLFQIERSLRAVS